MITIKKNKKPDLPICEMVCDVKLHKKLDNYDLTKFLNCHSCNLIVGKPASGKTNLIYQIMKKVMNKCFDKIYVFMPQRSRESMKDALFEQLPEDQKFEEVTIENLDYIKDNLEPDENTCILFDDMGAYLRNNQDVKNKLKEFIMNRRHLHLSIFFMVQTYLSLEPEVRKLFSNLFIFKVSKKEMEKIREELINKSKDEMEEISKIVYDKPYEWLFVNTDSQRLFKGWDEIIIDE
jgi:hypothetical protein